MESDERPECTQKCEICDNCTCLSSLYPVNNTVNNSEVDTTPALPEYTFSMGSVLQRQSHIPSC